jgi:signal transduction histidine kinase
MQQVLVDPICIRIGVLESGIDCQHGAGMSLATRRSIIETHDDRLRAAKTETHPAIPTFTIPEYSSASQ